MCIIKQRNVVEAVQEGTVSGSNSLLVMKEMIKVHQDREQAAVGEWFMSLGVRPLKIGARKSSPGELLLQSLLEVLSMVEEEERIKEVGEEVSHMVVVEGKIKEEVVVICTVVEEVRIKVVGVGELMIKVMVEGEKTMEGDTVEGERIKEVEGGLPAMVGGEVKIKEGEEVPGSQAEKWTIKDLAMVREEVKMEGASTLVQEKGKTMVEVAEKLVLQESDEASTWKAEAKECMKKLRLEAALQVGAMAGVGD